jgi:hypothetical protein
MKRKKTWIAIFILISLLGGCFGDRVISELVFSHHCKNNIGFFIYETVELDKNYIVTIPEDIREKDSRYELTDTLMIDKNKLYKKYDIYHQRREEIFSMGPVFSVKSTVIEKINQKKIGEVITYSMAGGWVARATSKFFPGGEQSCPIQIHKNQIIYKNSEMHFSLVKKIFLRKI